MITDLEDRSSHDIPDKSLSYDTLFELVKTNTLIVVQWSNECNLLSRRTSEKVVKDILTCLSRESDMWMMDTMRYSDGRIEETQIVVYLCNSPDRGARIG